MQEKVYFKNSKGHRLVGIIDRDENRATQELVMIFGNFNSYKYSVKQERIAEFFISLGFATFRFDYQGRGESEGNISYATITSGIDDTRSAVDFMKNQLWVDVNNIGLYGSGLGGDFALMESLRYDKYKFLLLSTPRIDLEYYFRDADIKKWRKQKIFNLRGVDYDISIYDDSLNYDIYKEAKKVATPTLIITGENEEFHSEGQDKKLKKAIKGSSLIVVKECNNIYCADAIQEAFKVVKQWLENEHIVSIESEWISQF